MGLRAPAICLERWNRSPVAQGVVGTALVCRKGYFRESNPVSDYSKRKPERYEVCS